VAIGTKCHEVLLAMVVGVLPGDDMSVLKGSSLAANGAAVTGLEKDFAFNVCRNCGTIHSIHSLTL
jgi:hypothetical protein